MEEVSPPPLFPSRSTYSLVLTLKVHYLRDFTQEQEHEKNTKVTILCAHAVSPPPPPPYEDLKLEKLKQQKHEVDGKNSSLLTC